MTKVEITAFKIANIFVGLFIFGKFLLVFIEICPDRDGGQFLKEIVPLLSM